MTIGEFKDLLETVPKEDLNLPLTIMGEGGYYGVMNIKKETDEGQYFSEDLSNITTEYEATLYERSLERFHKQKTFYVIG